MRAVPITCLKICCCCGRENEDAAARCCECGATDFAEPASAGQVPESAGSAFRRHFPAIGLTAILLFGLADALTIPAVDAGDVTRPVTPSAIRSYLVTSFILSLAIGGLVLFPMARKIEGLRQPARERLGVMVILGTFLGPAGCSGLGLLTETLSFFVLAGLVLVFGLTCSFYWSILRLSSRFFSERQQRAAT